MAFLMFMGFNGQKVDLVKDTGAPDFNNVVEKSSVGVYKKVKIDFFDNLSCTACDDFVKNTIPKIRRLEQETKDIELNVYFIPDINNEINYDSAVSLKCASDQGHFWEMLDKIHDNQSDLNKKSFIKFGKELELNTDALQECMKEDVYKSAVEGDVEYASEKNVTFKPSLMINGTYMVGNQPFENIQKIISQSLKKIQSSTVTSQ